MLLLLLQLQLLLLLLCQGLRVGGGGLGLATCCASQKNAEDETRELSVKRAGTVQELRRRCKINCLFIPNHKYAQVCKPGGQVAITHTHMRAHIRARPHTHTH